MSTLAPEVSFHRPAPAAEIPEYSVHLDAIRGTAACVVFLTHLRYLFVAKPGGTVPATPSSPKEAVPVHANSQTAAPARTGEVHKDYGHQAVIVFFVLSGYLVGGSVVKAFRQSRWRWDKYLVHRIVRLSIVLIPALVLGWSLDTLGSHHFAAQGVIYSGPSAQGMIRPGLDARLTAGSFFGNMFYLQDILVEPLGTNIPLWSLANEFWYYLAFPMLCLLIAGRGAVWRRIGWGILLAGLLYFVGPKIALYFSIWLAGVVAALLPLRIPARYQKLAALISLVLFVGVNLKILYHEPIVYPTDTIVAALFFLLLYCVLHLRAPFRDGIYRRGARFLSRISYSLYLTHVPVLCLASAIIVHPWRRLPLNLSTGVILLVVTASVFLVACMVHFAFEARTDQVRGWLEARL